MISFVFPHENTSEKNHIETFTPCLDQNSIAILKRILDECKIPVFIINPDMEVLWANKYITNLYPEGFTPGTHTCYNLIHQGQEKKCNNCCLPETVSTAKSCSLEVSIDSERVYSVFLSPVRDPGGEITCVLEMRFDITEYIEAYRRLEESETALKEKVEELEKFYEIAVHRELRIKELKKELERLKQKTQHEGK